MKLTILIFSTTTQWHTIVAGTHVVVVSCFPIFPLLLFSAVLFHTTTTTIITMITTTTKKRRREAVIYYYQSYVFRAAHRPQLWFYESPSKYLERLNHPLTSIMEVGAIVQVQSRTWPGINKPGGAGRVVRLNEDGSVNVKYILGGTEKNVASKYVKYKVLKTTPRKRKSREHFSKSSNIKSKRQITFSKENVLNSRDVMIKSNSYTAVDYSCWI